MTTTRSDDFSRATTPARRIGFWLSLAVLAATGVLGLIDGFDDLNEAAEVAQYGVQIGAILYGVLGCASLYAVLARRRLAGPLIAAWGVAVIVVATLAPLAYDTMSLGLLFGAISGGLITALIAYGVWLGVRPRLDADA